jgi:bacillithiol synthase
MTMVSFAQARFSRIFLDYTDRHSSLKPFYKFDTDREGYAKAMSSMQYNESIRPTLCSLIRKQYISSEISIPENLILSLEKENTFTVCTGHQLCLFTGPFYFIYKIISVIKLAESLSLETGKTVIPVYWMASEDHDFEEIASVNLFGKTVKWNKPANGAVGQLKTDSIDSVLAEMDHLLGVSAHAEELKSVFAQVYRAGRKLSDATRELVHRIFKGKVLVLDGNASELKEFLLPVLNQDLFEQKPYQLVTDSITKLEKAGYAAQVNPRPINVFYMREGLRERIERKEENFLVLNTDISFSKTEIENELNKFPERFSPNVVLRPLYQQIILPNIAYVGGPGELAYWLQYREMFDQLGVFFPVLQPRHFALILDKAAVDKMQKMNLSPADFFVDVEERIRNYIAAQTGNALNFDSEKETFSQLFESVIQKAKAADSTLQKAAEAELQKAINGLDALQGKMMRAAKQKEETSVLQIRKLYAKIVPENNLQERYENFTPAYLQLGEELIELLGKQFEFPVIGIQLIEI